MESNTSEMGLRAWTASIKSDAEAICEIVVYTLRLHILHQYIHMKIVTWRKRKSGAKRSLVRRMSYWLPVSSSPKVYIKINVVRDYANRSLERSSATNSNVSYDKFQDGLNSIGTINNKNVNNYIYFRCARGTNYYDRACRMNKQQKISTNSSFRPEMSNITFIVSEVQASTPINAVDNENLSNNFAMQRMTQLEEELARLRQQITSIVIAQEASSGKIFSRNSSPPPSLLLPPPLPPPLPLLSQTSLKEQIQQNKLKNTQKQEEFVDGSTKFKDGLTQINSVPNMSEILKGLNAVKLRHVARSPGGTPLRKFPAKQTDSDPASLIAAALKRRFARIHPEESPDKENQESFENGSFAVENSPCFDKKLFGNQLFKSTKKSDIQMKSSPLLQINV